MSYASIRHEARSYVGVLRRDSEFAPTGSGMARLSYMDPPGSIRGDYIDHIITDPADLPPDVAVELFRQICAPIERMAPMIRRCLCGCDDPTSAGCFRRSADLAIRWEEVQP